MAQDFEIDSREFQQAAQKLMGLMRKTVPEFLMYQARLFVRDCLRATPPFGRHSIKEKFSLQRKLGERAVRRDIGRVFMPAEKLNMTQGDDNLATSLRKYIRSGNLNAVQDIFFKIGAGHLNVISAVVPSIHKARRSPNGRVKAGKDPNIVLSTASVNSYVKEIVGHVGKFKSGWLKAANWLGVKGIPNWINRHSEPGMIHADLSHPTEPSLTVGNLSPFASRTEASIMDFAYRNRIRSMRTEIYEKMQHEFNKVNAR